IPITKPRLSHNLRKLSALDAMTLAEVCDQKELDEVIRIQLRMDFATTETEIHQVDITAGYVPFAQELLSWITNKVMQRAQLANVFSELYPIVRKYVANRCFGKAVDLDDMKIRAHLNRLDLREGIAKYLARKISELTVEKAILQFERADFKLS